LEVDNGAVTTSTDGDSDNCVWIQTDDNAFWSVTAEQYLSISTSSPYPLILQGTARPFTNSKGKLYFKSGSRNYGIRFSDNKFSGSRASNTTNFTALDIDEVEYNTDHKFTSVTPAEGVTQAFNTITLKTDVEMADLQLGYYYPDNHRKIRFYFSSLDGKIVNAESIITQGLDVKMKDRNTLEITTPQNLGEGTYRLEVEKGAVKGSDGVDFQAKTYTWTVNPHTFKSISPETVSPGEHLSDITLTAPEGVLMSIQDASKIVLKNAGNAIVPTTATIADNKLVITPAAPLGNGSYTLNIAKGAVVGPHLVAFNNYNKTWNVVVSVSITHVNGFYPALGAGGYQQYIL
jgi:methionine-rich copper-binding protein CopC